MHKHCFQFLLGLTIAPREIGNNAYEKFWRDKKEYYGIFEKGPFKTATICERFRQEIIVSRRLQGELL